MKRFLLIAAFALCWTQVSAQTLYVPSIDYSTIQSAINDANDGDVVIVAEGTYYENIDFLGRAITVRSADPNDPNVVAATIIDGSSPTDPNYGSAVTFKNGEDANSVLGGGLYLDESSINVVNNLFLGNVATSYGGGLIIDYCDPNVVNNTIVHNKAPQGGGI